MSAIDLVWYELYIPRGVGFAAVTGLMRPLASRPRTSGAFGRTPVVVFEVWQIEGAVRWLIGLEREISASVRQQLRAALPHLGLVKVAPSARPALTLAADIRLEGLSAMLRTEMAASVSAGVLAVFEGISPGEAAVVQWVIGPAYTHPGEPPVFDIAQALGLRSMGTPDATHHQRWREKITEPLFGVRGRIAAASDNQDRAKVIITRLSGALSLASSAHARLHRGPISSRTARAAMEAYHPRASWAGLLNAAELATVVAWPIEGVPQAEAHTMGGYRRPVPPALLVADEPEAIRRGDRIVGASLHPADGGRLVTVPAETSLRHVHIVGPTGSGKSTLLTDLVLSDAAAGRAIFLVEPKGDLIEDLLARMPHSRHNDVVIIDAAESDHPVGLNVLAGPLEEAERRADQLVHLLHELNSASWGPRTGDIALHALLALCRLSDGTFADLPALLGQAGFRRQVLAKVSDPLVLGPFFSWYDGLSEAERAQVVAPLLNKTRSFLSRQAVRRMLGQPRPRFELDDVFGTGQRRIVLVSLNRGRLGPEASGLLGALLLSQLWSAIQRRAALPAEARHPVMVVIDEFQDYLKLSVDFGEFLAQVRGLGVSLTVAHQHLRQLPAELRASTLANARSRFVFRPADDDLKPLAVALGIAPEDLAALGAYQVSGRLVLGGALTPAFGVATRPLRPATTNPDDLRAASRARFGADGAAVDAALLDRWERGASPPSAPIGLRPRRSS
ncbi:hypothetical protein ACG83_00015 [Frankia sp. R43]|uniref:type IV secretory system conjugative DNA transfer family protein n=1 Tax=Frankia sp. R43 TaxID=269536 RepID=UPI0006CA43CC|nr:ATP-binding protein [Frankia sp. R43]KPM56398.1 hypothetical protein ACG83_00015 [Frankia sp. R43]